MESLGYVDVQALTGTDKVDRTSVYFADGFEDAARRVADDLEIDLTLVAPLATAPSVPNLGSTQVLVYVGNDRR